TGWRVFPPRPGYRRQMQVRYEQAIGGIDMAVLVACAGSEVVGMAVADLGRPSSFSDEAAVEISSVIVRPAYRGRGIATLLVSRLLEFARRREVRRLTVRVFAPNEGARSFWSALG